MKITLYYALLAAAPLVSAQTYSGFTVNISNELDIIYGDTNLTNGQQLPRADVLSPPEIASPGTRSETGRACLIMMDSDVPTNTTARTTLLHWIAPDITGVTNGVNGSLLTLPPPDTGVPYQPPSPPVGDYPHRYTFLLYEQPRNFSIPSSVNASSRRGFDLEAFLSNSGLAQGAALAANYMLVANVSGPATTQFPPPLYTASSTLASSEANITPTSTPSSSSGSAGASATASASGSGAAATETASSTGEGATFRAGSGVALLAAIFGMFLM